MLTSAAPALTHKRCYTIAESHILQTGDASLFLHPYNVRERVRASRIDGICMPFVARRKPVEVGSKPVEVGSKPYRMSSSRSVAKQRPVSSRGLVHDVEAFFRWVLEGSRKLLLRTKHGAHGSRPPPPLAFCEKRVRKGSMTTSPHIFEGMPFGHRARRR